MKKYLSAAATGIGYGSFVYLLILSLNHSVQAPNQLHIFSILFQLNIFSILLMSAGIGIVSLIFDWEDAPYWLLLLLHFLGTFSLVVLMTVLNHLFFFVIAHFFYFFSSFVCIYLFVWIIIRINQAIEVTKINRKLKNRKKE